MKFFIFTIMVIFSSNAMAYTDCTTVSRNKIGDYRLAMTSVDTELSCINALQSYDKICRYFSGESYKDYFGSNFWGQSSLSFSFIYINDNPIIDLIVRNNAMCGTSGCAVLKFIDGDVNISGIDGMFVASYIVNSSEEITVIHGAEGNIYLRFGEGDICYQLME